MSEKTAMVNSDTLNSESSSEVNLEEFNALKERVNQLSSTNARLLSESVGYKKKYTNLRDDREKQESQKLEEQENWKALLDKEKESRETLEKSYQELRKETLKKSLGLEVAKYARDAHDIKDIISNLDQESVTIDQENLTFDGLEKAVEDLRKKKGYLFSSKASKMINERPGFNKPKEKSINDMGINEAARTLKDLMLKEENII
jgi:hypothetical protein